MKLEPLLTGLSFGEGPRWRDGYVHQVRTVDERGKAETIVEVPGRPSGLGWRQKTVSVRLCVRTPERLWPVGRAGVTSMRLSGPYAGPREANGVAPWCGTRHGSRRLGSSYLERH